MKKTQYLFQINTQKLKDTRLSLGLTLKGLSEILSTNFSDEKICWRKLWSYENKETVGIPAYRLAAWCCALNFPIEDVFSVNPTSKNPLKIQSYKEYFSRTSTEESIISSRPAKEINNGLMFGLESLRHTENRGRSNDIYLSFDFSEFENVKNGVVF